MWYSYKEQFSVSLRPHTPHQEAMDPAGVPKISIPNWPNTTSLFSPNLGCLDKTLGNVFTFRRLQKNDSDGAEVTFCRRHERQRPGKLCHQWRTVEHGVNGGQNDPAGGSQVS